MKAIKFQAYVVKSTLTGAMGIGSPGIDEWDEMVEVSGISFVGEEIDYVTDKDGDEYSFVDESLKAVREFTGLKDKKGVEIYEGDILEYPDLDKGIYLFKEQPNRTGVIKWHEQDAAFKLPGTGFRINQERVEVIGNVYKNPELLNTKK